MEINAISRASRGTRPPARRLLEPVRITTNQPTLPMDNAPTLADSSEIDPEAKRVTSGVSAAIIEAIAGRRSLTQLEGWVAMEPLELLEHLQRSRLASGLRLRSLRLQAPTPEVIEVAAHLRVAGGSRAAALRFTRNGRRWMVTRLELALQSNVVTKSARARW